jgi:hypothetical protein
MFPPEIGYIQWKEEKQEKVWEFRLTSVFNDLDNWLKTKQARSSVG